MDSSEIFTEFVKDIALAIDGETPLYGIEKTFRLYDRDVTISLYLDKRYISEGHGFINDSHIHIVFPLSDDLCGLNLVKFRKYITEVMDEYEKRFTPKPLPDNDFRELREKIVNDITFYMNAHHLERVDISDFAVGYKYLSLEMCGDRLVLNITKDNGYTVDFNNCRISLMCQIYDELIARQNRD